MTFQEEGLQQKIYTVSELTDKINFLLEEKFPFVWISGEISNFRMASSGHFYFTLKDESAQISSVMFRGQNRSLKFDPSDGISITGLGRLSVYKPRGNYQIIFEFIEPKGIGELQVAFEQLKRRLEQEGLFEAQNKRPLPFLPQKIGIVTSIQGAVIHDILKIAKRRYPNLNISILPTRVQGIGSEIEIKNAIETANQIDCDVIILARGGGSLEDLQAFNSEMVARAIFESTVPVVSAVGHETDYTISDFVADLRAPTPSAAAEMIIPLKEELIQQIDHLERNLVHNMIWWIRGKKEFLSYCTDKLADPQKRIQELGERADELLRRLIRTTARSLREKTRESIGLQDKLKLLSPEKMILWQRKNLERYLKELITTTKNNTKNKINKIQRLSVSLNALSPLAILERGYSVTRTFPDKKIVKSAGQVSTGQELEIQLYEGRIGAVVNKRGIVRNNPG